MTALKTRSRVRAELAGWLTLCATILHRVPSLPGALCAGRPELFDAKDGPHGEGTRTAIRLCRQGLTTTASRSSPGAAVNREKRLVANQYTIE